MSLVDRIKASANAKTEKRVVGGAPWTPWDSFSTGGYFDQGGPVHPSQSVNAVSSTEGALALPALYAGTKILASNAASLPLKLYTTQGNGRVRYYGPSIFDQPSVDGTVFNWVYSCMTSLILRGNAWGLITGRDGFGFPAGVEWIPAELVSVQPDGDSPWNIRATKVYAYGREVRWFGPNADVIHLKAFSIPGRLEGLSLIQLFGLTLLQGREAQNYGTKFFQTGGWPKGSFQNNQMEVNEEQSKAIRRMLTTSIKTGEPLVYGSDWDYKPFNIPVEQAQFLQTMGVNATQIAALLDLPPERLSGVKGSMTYSSTIQSQLAVADALTPWLALMEASFSQLIPANRTASFDVRAMLRTDPLTEAQIEQLERDSGTLTADEIREMHDRAPLANGVGSEALPQVVLASMARGAGVIPKTWAGQVELAPQPVVPDSPDSNPQAPDDQAPDDQATTQARAISDLLRGGEAA